MKATKLKLKENLKKGWQIESVEKPKPDPQKLILKAMEQSSKENQEILRQLAKSVSDLSKYQNIQKETIVKVEMPKENKTKKEWHFTINRNRNGFIDNITAKEI